jgi:hypothetical protein
MAWFVQVAMILIMMYALRIEAMGGISAFYLVMMVTQEMAMAVVLLDKSKQGGTAILYLPGRWENFTINDMKLVETV